MNLNFLKLKREKIPAVGKLRPKLFDANIFWFLALGACLLVFLVTAFVGFRLFYMQSYESGGESVNLNNSGNFINTDRIKDAVVKRENFVNEKISIPRDPSM